MNPACVLAFFIFFLASTGVPAAQEAPFNPAQIFEKSFSSKKSYRDSFNDVDVDVIFTNLTTGQTWRVPAFWRGGSQWTVRFRPPSPGKFVYRLHSTDPSNSDLSGHEARVTIGVYGGKNPLLRRGALRVSDDRRYLEHTDGTPFYWLGDGLYSALSDRIDWKGFRTLIADRKAKGFTVVEVAAGLVCSNEERAPVDPGFRNEGGPVWDEQYKQINPRYFDYADRRIQYTVDSGLMPAIIGAWFRELEAMGVEKMQKHWRYIIARYGAYPVLWILGGEVNDPPLNRLGEGQEPSRTAGWWTQVARYIRATDPYGRLLTAHELFVPHDIALQDESLTDFDLIQASHFGEPSIAMGIAQLNTRWSSTHSIKPLILGEIGYEGIGGEHLQNFQRSAFWLSMLNGAAGYSYGTTETALATSASKPLHRVRFSFFTWEEAMRFPGSYQVGLGAGLLRGYPWWRIAPHPEWVSPGGTTLLEPHEGRHDVDLGQLDDLMGSKMDSLVPLGRLNYPLGEWAKRGGNFRLPYAAGIPRQLRVIYIPYYGVLNFFRTKPPTVLELEDGVRYHAYYWEPSLGIKFDLGAVENPAPGKLIQEDRFGPDSQGSWVATASVSPSFGGRLAVKGRSVLLLKDISESNFVAAVDVRADTDAALLLRYRDEDNHLAAIYSAREKAVYLSERQAGKDGAARARTPVNATNGTIRLMAEVRDDAAIAAIRDGDRIYPTAIETVAQPVAGAVGLQHQDPETEQTFKHFELRASPTLVEDEHLERKLYDANGTYRGELAGGPTDSEWPPAWDDFGKRKRILLGGYRPDRVPSSGDWVLVLENREAISKE